MCGRKECRHHRHHRHKAHTRLNMLMLKHSRFFLRLGVKRWKRLVTATNAAVIIQHKYRPWLVYIKRKRRRAAAQRAVNSLLPEGVSRAISKMRANVIIQSAFRREFAHRRVRRLGYRHFVTAEEKAAVVAGRLRHASARSAFSVWREKADAHHRHIIRVQAKARTFITLRIVAKLMARRWGGAIVCSTRS
jgi:hypothetical protein